MGLPRQAAASIRIGTDGWLGVVPVHAARESKAEEGVHFGSTAAEREKTRPAARQRGDLSSAMLFLASSKVHGTASKASILPCESSVINNPPGGDAVRTWWRQISTMV